MEELLREHAPDAMKCPISYVFTQRPHMHNAHMRAKRTSLALTVALGLTPGLALALAFSLTLSFMYINIPPPGKTSCGSRQPRPMR